MQKLFIKKIINLEQKGNFMNIEIWQFILILVGELIAVAIATFFVTRKIFANQLKKNPTINNIPSAEIDVVRL